MVKVILVAAMLFIASFQNHAEEFIVTHRAPESEIDKRFDYSLELLKHALDKTKSEYGGYKLMMAPNMNFKRAQKASYISRLTNFVFDDTASRDKEEKLLSIKIPIAKGIYGYRLLMIRGSSQSQFNLSGSLDDLVKNRLGQGKGWLDVKILRHNGFKVLTGSDYDGLFKMLASGRFDAFPRAINEVYQEVEARELLFPELKVEKHICLYYPLPRFFYTSPKNTLLAERLTKGLGIMMEDGSFDRIWNKHHAEQVKKARIGERLMIKLDNPYLPDFILHYNPAYWYHPK